MFVDRVRPEGAGPRSPAKRSDTQDLLPCHRRMSLRSCGLLAIEQVASIKPSAARRANHLRCHFEVGRIPFAPHQHEEPRARKLNS